MEFFHSQESLTAVQWTLRAVIAFFFLLIVTKLMGERSISQLRLIDFTMALILGNILAHPLSDEGLGMKGSLITTTVLTILYILFIFLTLKWNAFRKLIEPAPYPLIQNGEIRYANLRKARITIDHLLSEIRKEKIVEIESIALALWEPDGTISFFLSPQQQPLTPMDVQLVKKPFSFPAILIREGKVDSVGLQQAGKDMEWLKDKLSFHHVEIRDILLATIDQGEMLKFYYYR
ncbi:YetF domain-containing protein [Sporosarcina sp. 179-K 3D1 HS]|uniref:DUF421 domain-containing protein n=1 Tax=Sporosarcina sp. 179-K 3D1 HS TaxID=3232169 RepID=UPI0039A38072